MVNKIILILLAISVGLWVTVYFLAAGSPGEVFMGEVQKIMYIHVSSILYAYVLYFGVFVFSWGYLWKKHETFDLLSVICTQVATIYCMITLVTGALWGKPTWNTYWVWDPRLTLTLLIFMIFAANLLIRNFSLHGQKQRQIFAILGILGFSSIPLNHLAVNWWRTLHQGSTMFSDRDTLSDEYRFILNISFLAMLFTSAFFVLLAWAKESKAREYHKLNANR